MTKDAQHAESPAALEFWASTSWVDIWAGVPLQLPAPDSAAGLVRIALLPGSNVNFPQITEICERIAAEPPETADAVGQLVSALWDVHADFRKKLKALTISNEMMYDENAVFTFQCVEGLHEALAGLRAVRDTGLGEPMDANIRMLATEVDRACFSDGGAQNGRLRKIGSALRNTAGKLRKSDQFTTPTASPKHVDIQLPAPARPPVGTINEKVQPFGVLSPPSIGAVSTTPARIDPPISAQLGVDSTTLTNQPLEMQRAPEVSNPSPSSAPVWTHGPSESYAASLVTSDWQAGCSNPMPYGVNAAGSPAHSMAASNLQPMQSVPCSVDPGPFVGQAAQGLPQAQAPGTAPSAWQPVEEQSVPFGIPDMAGTSLQSSASEPMPCGVGVTAFPASDTMSTPLPSMSAPAPSPVEASFGNTWDAQAIPDSVAASFGLLANSPPNHEPSFTTPSFVSTSNDRPGLESLF